MKAEHFNTFDVTEIPIGPTNILKDQWFWCVDGDPKKALMYKKYSPQCNSSKSIAETFTGLKKIFPTASIVFIETVFCPLDMRL